MLSLPIDPPKVFILIIPLTFRPSKGRGRPFSWVANSFQASKFSICTLFQSWPSSYQGNVVRLLGVRLNEKVTSGKPSKYPVHSYCLGNLALMLCLSYCQFFLGLLFFYPDCYSINGTFAKLDWTQCLPSPLWIKSSTPRLQYKRYISISFCSSS